MSRFQNTSTWRKKKKIMNYLLNKTPDNPSTHQDTQKQHKVHINQIKVLEKNTGYCKCQVLMATIIYIVHVYILYISNVHVPM